MKFKQFVMVGIIALGAAFGAHAHADTNNIDNNYFKETIQTAQAQGYFKQQSDIKVMKGSFNGSPAVAAPTFDNDCKVYVDADGNGNLKADYITSNLEQQMFNKFAMTHEGGHCELFAKKDKIFNLPSLTAEQNDMLTKNAIGTTLYQTLQENFADTMAAMVILKDNNFSKESVNFVFKTQQRRNLDFNSWQFGNSQSGEVDPHFTQESLKLVVANIDNIKKLSNAEFEDFALKLANQGLDNLIKSDQNIKDKLFSKDKLASEISLQVLTPLTALHLDKDASHSITHLNNINSQFNDFTQTFIDSNPAFKNIATNLSGSSSIDSYGFIVKNQNNLNITGSQADQVKGQLADQYTAIILSNPNSDISKTISSISDLGHNYQSKPQIERSVAKKQITQLRESLASMDIQHDNPNVSYLSNASKFNFAAKRPNMENSGSTFKMR